jgi:hypothetical protein
MKIFICVKNYRMSFSRIFEVISDNFQVIEICTGEFC